MGRRFDHLFGGWQGVVEAVNTLGGFLLVAFMFGLIYKIMPRERVRVADVWLGALMAALLFTGGKSLIGAYIGQSGVTSGFGAAGSLVVVLLWVYFSAQILLLGPSLPVFMRGLLVHWCRWVQFKLKVKR